MKKLCHSIQWPMKIIVIHTGSEGRIVVNCAFYPPQTSDHLEFTHVILLIGRVSLTDFCFSEDLSHANIHTQTLCSFLHESIIGGIGSGSTAAGCGWCILVWEGGSSQGSTFAQTLQSESKDCMSSIILCVSHYVTKMF